MTTDTATPAPDTKSPRYGWPSIVVAVVFGLLHAYVLWTAIGNLVNVPAALASQGLASLTPWWLLILDVVVPVAAYVVAFILGRRFPLLTRSAFFLLALAVVSCSTVGSIAYTQTH
jgi:hypothetical protein